MERIKDFLYDISDLLISLLIIAVIFTVISWKLNESIPIETVTAPPVAEEPAAEPDPSASDPSSVQPDSEATTPSASTDGVTDASDADKPITESPTGTTPPADSPAQPPTKPENPTPGAGTAVTIEIPSGSPGVAIGKILKDNGLITDVSAFIKKVDELGLGPKLRSGSFKLKTGMTLEQIIKTLANVN